MKRNSKAALKSVPKSQNGIVITQTGTKTYSTAAAAAGPSKVNRSVPNGTGVTGDGAAGDAALPPAKLNRKNGSVMNSDPGEGTVLDESKVYVAGNGVLDPRKRNGISVGNGPEGKPGKQTDRQTNHADAERWMQGPVSIGVGDPVTTSGLAAVMDRTPDRPAVTARNNEPRKFVAENKGIVTDGGVQRQNVHELRPVKILQRPASVAKCQTPEKNPEHDLFSSGGSPQERRHREKCLSLNTEEREHLENLIENLIISCVDNEDDSSGDETNGGPDLAPRMMRHDANHPRQNVDHGRSPGKAEGYAHRASSGGSSASKTEREARSETPRGMGGRIEAGGKGRKFVRETSGNKNAGRGRDQQGKRRETSRVKDNRKTGGDFQPTRPANEEMRQQPPPQQQDNLQERQDMMSADVYPAQLKVAIKHMDALPPRFLRRIQNGKGGIGGSEPTLPMDDRSETPTPPEADLRASSSTGKDLDKLRLSKKQGVKNMIRNLLNNMDDDDNVDQQSESCARTLDFALGAIGERREMKVTDSLVRDAFLSGGSQSSDVNVDNTPMTTTLALFSNGFDSFQHRAGTFGQQQHPGDGFPPQGSVSAASQALNPNADFRNYQPYAGEWRSAAYNGYLTTANNSKKMSFSVNAPEFVSKLYEPNPAADTNNSGARDNDVNANLLRYCGVNANDGVLNNHLNSQEQLMSGIPRNNLVQPEYYGTLRSYAPFSGNIPGAVRDAAGAAYPNQDASSFANEVVAGHGPANADLVQSMRMMQYGGARGYLQPTHHQMQMLHQQQQQRLSQQQQQQLQQLSQQQQLLNQQQQQLLTQQQQQQLLSQQQQQQQLLSQQQQLLAHQMLPASQPLVSGGGMRLPVTGIPTSLPWFPGNPGGVYSTTVVPSQNALPLQPMPFDVGRQMLMRLMNEGKHVMVILVGRVDDNKLSLISELQTNVSGTLVLNLRNGMCHNNDEKEMEFHRWNYKQALEGTQLQKNPIIIDHTYAQPWQMKDYIGLAQMNKYLVQIIDCDETRQYHRAIPNAGSYGRDDPLFQSAMEYNNMPADKEDATAGDNNRCNIPGVENNTSSSNSSQLSTSPPLPVALSFSGGEVDVVPGGVVALAQKL